MHVDNADGIFFFFFFKPRICFRVLMDGAKGRGRKNLTVPHEYRTTRPRISVKSLSNGIDVLEPLPPSRAAADSTMRTCSRISGVFLVIRGRRDIDSRPDCSLILVQCCLLATFNNYCRVLHYHLLLYIIRILHKTSSRLIVVVIYTLFYRT